MGSPGCPRAAEPVSSARPLRLQSGSRVLPRSQALLGRSPPGLGEAARAVVGRQADALGSGFVPLSWGPACRAWGCGPRQSVCPGGGRAGVPALQASGGRAGESAAACGWRGLGPGGLWRALAWRREEGDGLGGDQSRQRWCVGPASARVLCGLALIIF